MTYLIGSPSGTLNSRYSRTKKQPPSAIDGGGPKLSALNTDQVQFGMRNRALEAKRAKRLKHQENRNLQQAEVESVEKHIAGLCEDNLHVKNKRAFEDEVIDLLDEYPSMSMNFSLHPDLENKNKIPAIPFLHFAMANKCFKLAGYILYRDDNLDLTKKDYRGHTALQVAESVAQYAREDEEDDAEECTHYADWLGQKVEDYLLVHPEKRTGTNTLDTVEESPATSAIQLKGFSEKELEEFIDSNGIEPDSAASIIEKQDGTSTSQLSKAQKKKQKATERRIRLEQAEKEKRNAEIQKKQEQIDAKLEALHVTVTKQQAENARREAEEKAMRKTRELNARLNAMPELPITDAMLEEHADESEAAWETVKSADKAASKKQPNRSSTAKRQAPTRNKKQAANKPPAKATPAEPKASVPAGQTPMAKSVADRNTKQPIQPALPLKPTGQGIASTIRQQTQQAASNDAPSMDSPTEFPPISPEVESPIGRSEDLLQGDASGAPVVRLPEFKNPFVASPELPKSPLSPPAGPNERSSHVRSFSMSSRQSNHSLNSLSSVVDRQKIEKLKKERDEKQFLLEQASAFNKRTTRENQETMNKAFRAFNEASLALAKAQQLQMEKSIADRNAFHWQDVARNWQQAAHRQARYHQEELNTLKKAYNAQRSELLKLQEAAQQQNAPVENDKLEAGLGVLETMQGEIQQREVKSSEAPKQPPFSKDPNDYEPCKEGGFKILRGFGQGSWVPQRPSGK